MYHDESGDECAIIDENNDEDLTNDQIHKFSQKFMKTKDIECQTESISTIVTVDYFDGITKASRPLYFGISKVMDRNGIYCYSKEMKVGNLTFMGNQYMLAMGPDIFSPLEYSKRSYVWIDSNQNQTYDQEDLVKSLGQPFTFKGHTFKASTIDRFGEYVVLDTIRSSRIEINMKFPDINLKTIHNEDFLLSEQNDYFVLVEFWKTDCGNSLAEIPFLKKASTKYKNRNLKIVSIGIDSKENILGFINDNHPDWTQIQVNTARADEIKDQYQFRGFPTVYLINPEGLLIESGMNLRQKKLLLTLEKYLSQ